MPCVDMFIDSVLCLVVLYFHFTAEYVWPVVIYEHYCLQILSLYVITDVLFQKDYMYNLWNVNELFRIEMYLVCIELI